MSDEQEMIFCQKIMLMRGDGNLPEVGLGLKRKSSPVLALAFFHNYQMQGLFLAKVRPRNRCQNIEKHPSFVLRARILNL
jgi:hypothetical protein